MSLTDNRTGMLWKSFMPERVKVADTIGTALYSINVYDDAYFHSFNPHTIFEKWAAVEVSGFNHIPETMEAFTILGGLYAVFFYKGAAKDGGKAFRYIFESWLPQSEYRLDNRPHFEVLGDKYKNDDPSSEEEIWIPVTTK